MVGSIAPGLLQDVQGHRPLGQICLLCPLLQLVQHVHGAGQRSILGG